MQTVHASVFYIHYYFHRANKRTRGFYLKGITLILTALKQMVALVDIIDLMYPPRHIGTACAVRVLDQRTVTSIKSYGSVVPHLIVGVITTLLGDSH